jgi:preprotein translocase subunit YajC
VNYLPVLIIAALFIVLVTVSRRNRQRVAANEAARIATLQPGSEVMTTSGLYGTVVAINPDGTALLSIAAGVEVKWTIAALREVTELPDQYRLGPNEVDQRELPPDPEKPGAE